MKYAGEVFLCNMDMLIKLYDSSILFATLLPTNTWLNLEIFEWEALTTATNNLIASSNTKGKYNIVVPFVHNLFMYNKVHSILKENLYLIFKQTKPDPLMKQICSVCIKYFTFTVDVLTIYLSKELCKSSQTGITQQQLRICNYS